MNAQLILITVTSTLFVKIPWALTRVYAKLDIQEMENNVVVRTISKKYSQKDWRPFKIHTTFYQYYRLKITQFPYCRSACIDREDNYACEQVLHSKLGEIDPRSERLEAEEKRGRNCL